MNTELLISNIILTLGAWSLLLLAMVKRTKIERANQSSQEKMFRTIRRMEELLLDGGGKPRNISKEMDFQDELMKNFIKESINEIIESSRYFDHDYTPQSGDIEYGHLHTGDVRNNEGASRDWYLDKQKKNRKIK